MIKINSANFISELGKRNNNEDNCAINPNKTYIVCDGVGGSEKGEIASDIVVREFIKLYDTNPDIYANDAIKYVEAKLTNHINNHPETMGMATTLTLAQIKNDSIYVAWCGDSRIYQFRSGKIIFKTIDHSWVNEAIKAGIITEEEAINHPKSNVITRAIQGQHKPVKIEDCLLTDIQIDDTFLLCSDGILESWNDDDLEAIFTSQKNIDAVMQKIKSECSINSRDNFTAIIFKLDQVDKPIQKLVNEPNTKSIIAEEIEFEKNTIKQQVQYNYAFEKKYNQPSKKKKKSFIIFTLIITLLLSIGYLILFRESDTNNKKSDSSSEQTKKNPTEKLNQATKMKENNELDNKDNAKVEEKISKIDQEKTNNSDIKSEKPEVIKNEEVSTIEKKEVNNEAKSKNKKEVNTEVKSKNKNDDNQNDKN